MKIRIATRQSQLALAQTKIVQAEILAHFPNWEVSFIPMTTEGDRKQEVALSSIGGKGLFIKELEQALLENRADIAVHSMKDLPAVLDSRFCLPAVLKRADSRDVLLSEKYENLQALPEGAIVGTSSLRRQAQLKRLRRDLEITLLRGNVLTRVHKLREGQYDAIILAAAGLERLSELALVREYFPISQMLPAPGQGAIGIECLARNTDLQAALKKLTHIPTEMCVKAEREVAHQLQASCRLPIGIYAEYVEDQACLSAKVFNEEGSEMVEAFVQSENFASLPAELTKLLFERGVQTLLDQFP